MTRKTRQLVLLSSLCLAGCGDDAPVGPGTETGSTGSTGTPVTTDAPASSSGSTDDADTTEGADASSSSEGGEVPPSSNWCDRLVAGPAGDTALLDLAVAHAYVRFFGAEADYPTVDAALAEALAPVEALGPLDLAGYDDALESVCIVTAEAGAIGPASVEMMGTIAWVRPGTGDVVLPVEAQAVALDLRELPNVPELPALLAAAVAPASTSAIDRPTQRVRRHNGHTDQTFAEQNVYSTELAELTPMAIEPTGSVELELFVVTGERLPAAAAELAGTLRLHNRAWLVGHDVLTEVAESSWSPIGGMGAAWRSRELLDADGARWPDAILADVRTSAPEDVVAALAGNGSPPPADFGGDARSGIAEYDPWSVEYPEALGLGEIRGALVVAYGVVELFFPYFDVVGHETDEALLELLAETDPADAEDRPLMVERLRRFSSVLQDGHAFVRDFLAMSPTGGISARIEALDGYPVVRRTNNPGLQPGDTILEIEGEPALDWYAARQSLVSAASDGYRHDLVTRMLTRRATPIELTTESALGVMQTLFVDPVDAATNEGLGSAPVLRPSDWLDDLGAPGLYYINVGNATTNALDVAIDAAIAGAAAGMVVDMRGYPFGVDHYFVAQRLIPGSFESARFVVPVRTGPDVIEQQLDVYQLDGIDAYDGPMVLIVGHHSVSAAENFSIMLVAADRVTVVGRQSASTNGNITGMRLPGGFGLSFTGMNLLFPDGSTFHGVGIVPDVEVSPDPVAYAQGDDPELLAAIDVLTPLAQGLDVAAAQADLAP